MQISSVRRQLKADFLKLCFFDIWLANEDRSHNNYNILLIRENEHYELFPIDHEACFNHNELNGRMLPITYEESLIYSEAFAKLFKTSDLTRTTLVKLREQYYLCKTACERGLNDILGAMPSNWQVDIQHEGETLARFLFDDQWFNEAWETFLSYIDLYLENKHK